MYRNIFLVILIIFMAGCSSSKVKPSTTNTQAAWYLNPPQDEKLFYSVAIADTVKKAKKIAIVNMRNNLAKEINKRFATTNNELSFNDEKLLQKIQNNNLEIAMRLSLNRVRLEKTQTYYGRELVLLSIPKQDLFNKIKMISNIKLGRAKQADKRALNKTSIDRFIALKVAMSEYSTLVCLAEYKKFLLSSYDSSAEFEFLHKIKNEYDYLKNNITFYILTDANSKIFAKAILYMIKSEGLHVENELKTKDSFEILVTSTTQESQVYAFNQSKVLVKLTTFDNNKNKIKFRQHTVIGKSKRSYVEAKKQASRHFNYKIKKLGLFDFLGFDK